LLDDDSVQSEGTGIYICVFFIPLGLVVLIVMNGTFGIGSSCFLISTTFHRYLPNDFALFYDEFLPSFLARMLVCFITRFSNTLIGLLSFLGILRAFHYNFRSTLAPLLGGNGVHYTWNMLLERLAGIRWCDGCQ
jgi:hypothetical protein